MKPSLHITATVDQPDLLKNLVEKLAYRRNDDFSKANPSNSRKTFKTSSTEAYVSGNIELDYIVGAETEQLHIPFITCFIFTCKRADADPYELAWSHSLS